ALLGLGAAAAQAPAPHPPLPPSKRAAGEATVTARPDRAVIDIAVFTEAPAAQAAAAQNATRLDAVLRAVKTAAGPAADIRTVSYSLDPNYRYPKPGGQPELAGYTARNSIQVTTADLDSAGKIIDAATRSGANSIDRLQFTLKDDAAPRAEALRLAAAKARTASEAIAAALGVRIVRVLLAQEEGGGPEPVQPMFKMARMAESAVQAPTPVAPGTIEVRAGVTLTVEIAQ
ncbi:MAG TPA: SIMPL domain-containing protein, partial [Bryobacteraceae bacterium]|nr:SIMPL domain-containing protein [Bryobacteraceae bacterium]